MSKISYISIIGMPNAGKSTLLNTILGQKISIVTHKVQTTRAAIKGILTEGNAQLIFIDTPGIFHPTKKLEKAMVRCAWSTVSGVDIVCIIISIDSLKSINDEFKKGLEHIAKLDVAKILIFNKIDKIQHKGEVSSTILMDYFSEKLDNDSMQNLRDIQTLFLESRSFFISGSSSQSIVPLLNHVKHISPEGVHHYSEDEITDAPIKFLCSEITREQLFLQLSKELPYNLTVETEKWEQINAHAIKIYQNIIVSKDSHKMIILGAKGEQIKNIGTQARKAIAKNLGLTVHLFLFVKVREGWYEKSSYYENMRLS